MVESPKEGYGSKGAVLPMMMMTTLRTSFRVSGISLHLNYVKIL
jgi:hypothetical protein